MAYKNERDRICYQQNSCEPERHQGEMLGLSGIVLPPEPCGSNSNYHDPNSWHNHLSLPLMPAPITWCMFRIAAGRRRAAGVRRHARHRPASLNRWPRRHPSTLLLAPGRGLSSRFQPRGKTHEHRPSLVSLFI
jgi:hypothetical protein